MAQIRILLGVGLHLWVRRGAQFASKPARLPVHVLVLPSLTEVLAWVEFSVFPCSGVEFWRERRADPWAHSRYIPPKVEHSLYPRFVLECQVRHRRGRWGPKRPDRFHLGRVPNTTTGTRQAVGGVVRVSKSDQ